MAKRPEQEDFDRGIMDIIPERYDADEDAYDDHSGSRLRTIITIVVALFAVGGIVALGWKLMGSRHVAGTGAQVIKADDKAIKVRPDDRGGMQVPNQDKLVYGKMDNDGSPDAAKTERLLAPPEEPRSLPRPDSMRPEPLPSVPAPQAPLPVAAPPEPVQSLPIPVAPSAPLVQPPPVAAPVRTPAPAPKVEAPKPAAAPPPPPPAAAAPAPAPHKTVAESGGQFLVQLGAVRSADAADKEWARIQHANADLLSGLKSDVVEVEIPGKGTFWRIRAGSLSEQGARSLCQQLTGRNQGCILVHK